MWQYKRCRKSGGTLQLFLSFWKGSRWTEITKKRFFHFKSVDFSAHAINFPLFLYWAGEATKVITRKLLLKNKKVNENYWLLIHPLRIEHSVCHWASYLPRKHFLMPAISRTQIVPSIQFIKWYIGFSIIFGWKTSLYIALYFVVDSIRGSFVYASLVGSLVCIVFPRGAQVNPLFRLYCDIIPLPLRLEQYKQNQKG